MKSFGESKCQSWRLKQNLQFWNFLQNSIIICFYLHFRSLPHGRDGIFWANGKIFTELSIYILWAILSSLVQKLKLWIISKNFWKSEVTFFYLFNLILWACVILAFPNFWFIRIWQFQRNLRHIIHTIISDNYKFTNGSTNDD